MVSSFHPSHYQQAIFDFVRSGTGDGVVRATAGSGKTTTLVEIAKQLPPDLKAIFLAFNRHTADELRERLPRHVHARTVHSLGFYSLKQAYPGLRREDRYKSRVVVRECLQRLQMEFVLPKEIWPLAEQYLAELLNFSIANVTDTRHEEEVAALAIRYNLMAPPDVALERQCHREVSGLLRRRFEMLKEEGIYDFQDMLYIPAIQPKLTKIPQHDFVFVDEAQDLSPVQLRLVLRAVSKGGRRLFVGDERQAIYGFTGADADSLNRIVDETGATVLPLSITYRCPRSHVALASRLAPEIEAAPQAAEGKVYVIQEAWFPQWVRRDDLVICRYTAPLISHCLALIHQGTPALVKGMDIAKSLQDMAQLVFRTGLADWAGLLKAYRITEEARIRRTAATPEDADWQLAKRYDLIKSLEVLTRNYVAGGRHDTQGLLDHLQGFFSDDDQAPIMFSTIHKAKGKEADRVFILYPNTMPAVYARTKEAAEGEACVQFVALTRAKKELIFVEQKKREEQDDLDGVVKVVLGQP